MAQKSGPKFGEIISLKMLRLALYAEYLNKCSFVDQKFIKEFDGAISPQENVATKLATTIGLDSMVKLPKKWKNL
jgi:hypothetical protein